MTTRCEELLPAIAAEAAGLPLEDAERASSKEHLGHCPGCARLAEDVKQSLASARIEPRFASDGAWEKIAEGLRAERARALTAPALTILLSCTFCHAALDRREAVYCAACLAPHHSDCFETHGRCSATGCTETHTVSPRATLGGPRRRRSVRLPFVILALGSVAAVAFAGGKLTRRTPDASDAVAVESSSSVPVGDAQDPAEYPVDWLPAEPGTPLERLEQLRLDVRLESTPFFDAIDWLQERTGIRFVISESVRELVENEGTKVTLEAKNARAWDILGMILSAKEGDFKVEGTNQVVRIGSSGNVAARAHPALDVSALLESEADCRAERAKMKGPIALRFDHTPFDKVVEELRAKTGLAFTTSRFVDQKQVKIKFDWDGPLDTGLDELIWSTYGFAWQMRPGHVYLAPKDELPAAVVDPTARGCVELRGLTVPALTSQLVEFVFGTSVEVIATERAWRSRGTVSLTSDEGTIGALAELPRMTGLRASLVHAMALPSPRIFLVLDGEAPSVEEARACSVAPYPAVKTEVEALRKELEPAVRARRAARTASEGPLRRAALVKSESEVVRIASRILTLSRRSNAIAKASETRLTLTKALGDARAALARADAEVERAKPGLALVDQEIAKVLTPEVEAARLRLEALKGLAKGRTKEQDEALADLEAQCAAREPAILAARKHRLAAQEPLLKAQIASRKATHRVAELERDLTQATADEELAQHLEKGEPLALDQAK